MNQEKKKQHWSDELTAITQSMLDSISGQAGATMFVKHHESQYGVLLVISGGYEVIDRNTKRTSTYTSTDALLADGWIVD